MLDRNQHLGYNQTPDVHQAKMWDKLSLIIEPWDIIKHQQNNELNRGQNLTSSPVENVYQLMGADADMFMLVHVDISAVNPLHWRYIPWFST